MTDLADLERRYRRLLRCYPRAFRHENGDEIIAVLLALGREGQRWPSLAESASLIRNAFWVRLRLGVPRSERTVLAAVKLMYAGAALELAYLITLVMTTGSVRSAILQRYPGLTAAQWHAVAGQLFSSEVAAVITIGAWLVLAWALGRGYGWARIAFSVFFGFNSLGVLFALALDAPVYVTAAFVVGAVAWLAGFAVVVLIFIKQSSSYYRRQPAAGQPAR